jgi:Flp pilus assembly protein TadG
MTITEAVMGAFFRHLGRSGRPDRPSLLIRACEGGTLVEFALVMVIFLTIILGIIEFGRIYWTQSTLQQAVEAAARCASIGSSLCSTESAVQDYAVSQMFGFGDAIPSNAFTVDLGAACGKLVTGMVSASAPYVFSITGPFTVTSLFPSGITLSAQSCYPNSS